VRPVNVSGANQYAFINLCIWLIDLTVGQGAPGSSLIGGAKLGSELREMFAMDYPDTNFFNTINMFPIIWAPSPISNVKEGTCTGY